MEVPAQEVIEPHHELVGLRSKVTRVDDELDFVDRLGQVAILREEGHVVEGK